MNEFATSTWLMWAGLFAIFGQAFEPYRKGTVEFLASWIRIAMLIAIVVFVPFVLWLFYLDYRSFGALHVLKTFFITWIGGVLLSIVAFSAVMIPLKAIEDREERMAKYARRNMYLSLLCLLALFPLMFAIKARYA